MRVSCSGRGGSGGPVFGFNRETACLQFLLICHGTIRLGKVTQLYHRGTVEAYHEVLNPHSFEFFLLRLQRLVAGKGPEIHPDRLDFLIAPVLVD